ncbi:MAG: DUF6456 domain-containing protein [Paracoccaceae bacterium]
MTKLDTDTNTEATASLDRAAKFYVWNQHHGKSMRDIAKTLGCHPSTVMRHIHKIAKSKDNPKVARAISAVSTKLSDQDVTVDQQVAQAIKFLRQKNTVLAVATGMERGVVFGQDDQGVMHKLMTIALDAVHVLVIRGDVRVQSRGRVVRYQHVKPDLGALWLADVLDHPKDSLSHVVPLHGDSPLETLTRRKGPDGAPFLSRELVLAGLRLSEDFILSGCQSEIETHFEKVLIGQYDAKDHAVDPAAWRRFQRAICDLGPSLADIAVRSCCLQEGIERSEAAMDWSARSGKIVLRIALQRLKRHYDMTYGAGGGLIG